MFSGTTPPPPPPPPNQAVDESPHFLWTSAQKEPEIVDYRILRRSAGRKSTTLWTSQSVGSALTKTQRSSETAKTKMKLIAALKMAGVFRPPGGGGQASTGRPR